MEKVNFINPFSLISQDNPIEDISVLCQDFMNGCNLLALLLFNFVALECPYSEQTIYRISKLNRDVKNAVETDNYDNLEEMFLKSNFENIKELYIRFRFWSYDKKMKGIGEINKRLTVLGYHNSGDECFVN